MTKPARLCCTLVMLVLGCTRGDEPVRRDPTNAKTSEPSASATTSSASAPEGNGALPKIDTSCGKDADCGLFYTYLVDGKCCKGTCSPKAASGAHIANVDKLCQNLGYEDDHCPLKKCAEPGEPKCVSGQCTIKTP